MAMYRDDEPDDDFIPRPRFEIDSRSWIVLCLLGGIFLAAAGAALAVSEYPTTTDYGYGVTLKNGSWGGFWAGITMLGVGQAALFVALVAIGVMLGTQAGRR